MTAEDEEPMFKVVVITVSIGVSDEAELVTVLVTTPVLSETVTVTTEGLLPPLSLPLPLPLPLPPPFVGEAPSVVVATLGTSPPLSPLPEGLDPVSVTVTTESVGPAGGVAVKDFIIDDEIDGASVTGQTVVVTPMTLVIRTVE